MATDTMTSPLSMVSQVVPDFVPAVDNGVEHPDEAMDAGDDRSSSLSEISERGARDEQEDDIDEGFDAIDTEAETERLEDSPQKLRKHRNVVLSQTSRTHEDPQISTGTSARSPLPTDMGLESDFNRAEPTSEISSFADSGEDTEKALSNTTSSLRKRKRSSIENDSISDQDALPEPSPKATKFFRDTSVGTLVEDRHLDQSVKEKDQSGIFDTFTHPIAETRSKRSPENVLTKSNLRKGARKGKMLSENDNGVEGSSTPKLKSPARRQRNQDTVSSNEGEDDNEGTADVPEIESAVKADEAAVQQRTALDSLNSMETYFATFRDKLFQDRLTQCNEELAMLDSPLPTHPELLAMKEIIDHRRAKKIKYEQTLYKLKMQTLQRESIANKAAAHAQYMQTARDVRDRHLENLNEKLYQLQRERRNTDNDVPDHMLTFSTKRSQQITQQTAYNTEVSILSGVAKYVGFPAAPQMPKARPKEMEDDLRDMGIPSQAPEALHRQPPLFRATSSFSRQRSGAHERFLEQNPWANNPQHPLHHQPRQPIHRQMSALSRTSTPSATPAAQQRVIDLTEPQGSASTIPDNPSGPNSSINATPATAEAAKPGQLHQSNSIVDSTPSRVSAAPSEAPPSNLPLFQFSTSKSNGPQQTNKPEQNATPSLSKTLSGEGQTPNSLPKPLPFMHTGNSSAATPAPRTSTPGRYTIIKAEDTAHGARHSSMPRFNTPPVSTVGNGLATRFAT